MSLYPTSGSTPIGTAYEKTYTVPIPYAANTPSIFNLDVDCLLETLQFQLSGTLTLAGWATAPVKRIEAVENLIRSVQIAGTTKVSGLPSDTFCDVEAAYLAYQTKMLETTAPSKVDVGTANAAYNFSSTFKRYFGLKRHQGNYTDGFLETRNLATLTATLNWRDVNAMIQPGTGTGGGTSVLSGVQATVHSIQWRGGAVLNRKVYLKQSTRQFDLTNLTGLNQPFKNAPVGAWMPKQTFKTTAGDVDYADPTNAILATTAQSQGAFIRTVQGGDFHWLDSSAAQLQAKMKTDYAVESLPVGYYTAEYSRTKTWGGDLNLTQARTLDNILDLTTVGGVTNTLRITDEQVIFKN